MSVTPPTYVNYVRYVRYLRYVTVEIRSHQWRVLFVAALTTEETYIGVAHCKRTAGSGSSRLLVADGIWIL